MREKPFLAAIDSFPRLYSLDAAGVCMDVCMLGYAERVIYGPHSALPSSPWRVWLGDWEGGETLLFTTHKI